ncbi:MAG: hypothetical protein ACOCZH_01525 [Phototrophicaceae bacterium]
MQKAAIFNTLSLIFVVGTVAIIVFVAVQLASPADDDTQTVALPTSMGLPTETPTNTPTETLTPTLTLTPTDTVTPSLTPTEAPTVTPSATITSTPGPTETPSLTPTPADTATPTGTPTPEGPTLTFTPTDSPFLFEQRESVIIGPNNVNALGCAWQGIGGSVLGLDGNELDRQFRVRVFSQSGDFERVVTTGDNSLYGPLSGWEVTVSNTINDQTYFVRLESLVGDRVALSPDVQVTFPQDCNANAAIVRFIQVRPFGQQPAAP